MINQYSARHAITSIIVFVIILICTINASASSVTEFIGDDIPDKFYIGKQHIFYNSDSLFINDSLLVRDQDYKYIRSINSFDLSSLKLSSEDTLKIYFTPLPLWLKTNFGREIPTSNKFHSSSSNLNQEEDYKIVNELSNSIDISGAKSFRFNTASTSGSNFNQTLDLSISGNLTEQLEISGSISDRGYDPSYGTANSRLNELDKINLQIKSDNFIGKIGDIVYQDRFSSGISRDKRISGVLAAYQNSDVNFHATASRPRGQFQTIKLTGINQLQGPYRINANGGPIVPGSEQVWLDGKLLERGSNKDYLIDYSIGSITFNVNHPIDRRRRIEIDYEPQADDFKGEFFAGGGGISLGDSSVVVAVEWMREGDDRNQPLAGDISEYDKMILEGVGDHLEYVYRNGVTFDTNGSYIIAFDSIPEDVYQYVEPGNGLFSINFSYVGANKGDYSFIGNGVYQYQGENKADYLPITIIPRAQRTDQYLAKINAKNNIIGDLFAEIRKSDYDKNLFSDLDDDDNSGAMYTISLKRNWGRDYNLNYYNLNLRHKELNYQAKNRIYKADFNREFFLPSNFIAKRDESWYRFESGYSLSNKIRISPNISFLKYGSRFDSWHWGNTLLFNPNKLINTQFVCEFVRTNDNQRFAKSKGEVNKYSFDFKWEFVRRWSLKSGIEFDRRLITYTSSGNGTRYSKFTAELDNTSEKFRFERFDEDSLSGSWKASLLRNRLSLESNRQLGNLNYVSIISYQWLKEHDLKEQNLLGQLILRYNNSRKRLSFNMTYIMSDETRKARGISYLKVEPGEGRFIFEDGEYRPDPEGDYIKVEEILSEQAKVSRGEKMFGFTKSWDNAVFRFNSRINEELLDGETRSGLWVIPFLAENDNAYLYYNRHYNSELKLFQVHNFYAVTFGYSEDQEIRSIAGFQRGKRNRNGFAAFKQAVSNTLLEEYIELFNNVQDEYYSRAGDIDGLTARTSARQMIGQHELKLEIKYRRAESKTDDRSETYSIITTSRWNLLNHGQIRSSVEIYSQSLSNITSNTASYILTDNRMGSRGVIWSLNLRYGVSKSIKVNFNISGRHSDNRTARVTARGEMVAGF